MKELSGNASQTVTADPERCFAVLAAIDKYPSWYPEAIRRVDVLETADDGAPTKVRTELNLAYGPLSRTFDLVMALRATAPSEVRLTRLPNEPGDPEEFEVRWQIAPQRIALALQAKLSVPRLVPVAGIGESLANDFVRAASRELNS
jgi:ribosome-associated toxin RatA of RatAB toxin-antitoxin module